MNIVPVAVMILRIAINNNNKNNNNNNNESSPVIGTKIQLSGREAVVHMSDRP